MAHSPILVSGATGNIGGGVVAALVGAGRSVRAMVRDPGKAGGAFDPAVEVVAGDLDDPASVGAAAAGATGAFVLPGFGDMPGVYAALREAGIGHAVQLSGRSAEGGTVDNAVSKYMMESEAAARASGLAWTIVRPSAFMSNLWRWNDQLAAGDVIRAQFADVPTAMIDPADLGAVVAAAVGSGDLAGAVLTVGGPEALTPVDQVRLLGEGLGRPLRCVALTDDEAREEMLSQMPEAYVDAFFRFNRGGELDESAVLPTVQDVTGRPPGDLRAWIARNADSFPAPGDD